MNFCASLRLFPLRQEITVEEENVLYNKALETVIQQDEGRTLAWGNVRIGDIILTIDSDTRVVSQFLNSVPGYDY
jgi:hypothetical protein